MSLGCKCALKLFKKTRFRKPISFGHFGLKRSKPRNSVAMERSPNDSFHFQWMNELQPKFAISAKNVSILEEPSQFFEELKSLTKSCKRKITIASLYFGTSQLEKELVDVFHEALDQSDSKVKVQVLLDVTRGSRSETNSRTHLLPLLKRHPERMQVALYHSPHLRGWVRWILPERWNETVGLTHLKVYAFDDTLILSGANLNEQYFVNRQDRYMVFHNCPELTHFFVRLVETVCEFSLQLNDNNKLDLHPNWKEHPYLGNQEQFLGEASRRVRSLLSQSSQQELNESSPVDTWVVPLLQMWPYGIRQDEQATQALLVGAPPGSTVKIATGYFNMTKSYIDSILRLCRANFDVLVASPKVNGFFGASGVAGGIPAAYVQLERNFFKEVCQLGQRNRVLIYEYEREKWTFHAKGIWYYPPGAKWPVLSFIGSPNFGYRSVYKDLEAQVAVVTTNDKLQQQLHQEQERLYKSASIVSEATFRLPDHQVPAWVRCVAKIMKTFF